MALQFDDNIAIQMYFHRLDKDTPCSNIRTLLGIPVQIAKLRKKLYKDGFLTFYRCEHLLTMSTLTVYQLSAVSKRFADILFGMAIFCGEVPERQWQCISE